MSLICPTCKQTCSLRDGKTYGVHFANVLATRPCEMSCKSIVQEATPEPTPPRDLHHSQGVRVAEILAAVDEDKEKL